MKSIYFAKKQMSMLSSYVEEEYPVLARRILVFKSAFCCQIFSLPGFPFLEFPSQNISFRLSLSRFPFSDFLVTRTVLYEKCDLIPLKLVQQREINLPLEIKTSWKNTKFVDNKSFITAMFNVARMNCSYNKNR